MRLAPFAAGFFAAELVDGEGESIAAFSGAFVIGLVAAETSFAFWVNRRRAPGGGRRIRRSA